MCKCQTILYTFKQTQVLTCYKTTNLQTIKIKITFLNNMFLTKFNKKYKLINNCLAFAQSN